MTESSLELDRADAIEGKPDENGKKFSEFNVDDLLKDYVGSFGLWQWLITLMCILASPNMTTFPVFVNAVPKIRCRMESVWENEFQQRKLSFDKIASFIGPTEGDDAGCSRFGLDWSKLDKQILISSSSVNMSTQPCPHGYIYQTDDFQYPNTVVEEYAMVCDQEWLSPTGTFIYMVGMMAGFVIGGWLGDKYGRRPTAIGSSLLEIAASIIISTAPNHHLYHTARMVLAFGTAGKGTVLRILPMELTLARYRGFFASACIIGILFVHRSYMILLAYFIHNWRWLHAASMLPVAFSILFTCFLPESPRWLCSQLRFSEALAVLRSGSRVNRLARRRTASFDLSFPDLDQFDLPSQVDSDNRNVSEHQASKCCIDCSSCKDLFASKEIAKSILVGISLFAGQSCSMFGLLLYARIIKSHIYLVSFLNALASVPGPIIASILYRVFRRRRLPLQILYLIAGVSLMSGGLYTLLVKNPLEIVLNICCNVGIISFSATMIMLMIYTIELFPSSIRTLAGGMVTGLGRVGSSTSTFVNQLDTRFGHGFPVVIYASLALIQTGLLMLLRNTSGESLPDRVLKVNKDNVSMSSEKDGDDDDPSLKDCTV